MGMYLLNVAKNLKLLNNLACCSSSLICTFFVFFSLICLLFHKAMQITVTCIAWLFVCQLYLFFHMPCIVCSLMDFVLVLARTVLILSLVSRARIQRLFYTTSCHCWEFGEGTVFWGERTPVWSSLSAGSMWIILVLYPLPLVLLLLLFVSFLTAISSKEKRDRKTGEWEREQHMGWEVSVGALNWEETFLNRDMFTL